MSTTTTAAALISDSNCTPACLVAGGPDAAACSCRCAGAYHGKLAGAQIEVAQGYNRRPAIAVLAGQMELDLVG